MSQPLAVLSYNVCFEAMTNNVHGTLSSHHSGYPLGLRCPEAAGTSGLTECGERLVANVDAMPTTLGVPGFALVGFQEASRWDRLKRASAALRGMEEVHSKADHTEMASFYDPARFKLADSTTSRFDAYEDDGHGGRVGRTDRPFHILVLDGVGGQEGVLFINCHCPHGGATNQAGASYSDLSTVAKDLAGSLTLTDAQAGYRVVAVGDFNEAGWTATGPRDWTLFPADNSKPTLKMDAARFDAPPSAAEGLLTCCESDGRWPDSHGGLRGGHRGGDYIFDSAAPARARIPALDAARFDRTSDHLPVVAVL